MDYGGKINKKPLPSLYIFSLQKAEISRKDKYFCFNLQTPQKKLQTHISYSLILNWYTEFGQEGVLRTFYS